uniref:Vps8 domain-containing protein n=1 Tax=Angiostrongylus cantonensis TaxID=6313 RepID=A0A158P776_ANGCA
MNSISSSLEAEDWLDISDTPSLPSLSLDDIINEVTGLRFFEPDAVMMSVSLSFYLVDSISHQLLSFRAKNGFAVAIATGGGHIAVATSKGTLLIFDEEGRLERFWSSCESDGSASCVAFSGSGRYVVIGYSRGFVKIINQKSGAVEGQIKEAVQIGRGVLEVLFLDSSRTLLTLDSGGSTKKWLANFCVLHMRLMPQNLLALLTVMIISTRLRGSVICVFPMDSDLSFPPLLDYIEEVEFRNISRNAVVWTLLLMCRCGFKGLTTGGNVSPAMQCIAERACYQSVCRSRNSVIVLSHDELFELSLLSDEDQMRLFVDRGDFVSACMYLFDIYRGRVLVDEEFKDRVPSLLLEQLRRVADITMSGCKEGKISDLVSHYKAYISILLTVCIGAQMHTFLYDEVWVESDPLSRLIFLESLDEFVLDGTLESPPPSIVSAYIRHLASEGHFSQLQASVVRFPIHCVDIHYVMSTCKQNGLYDGIIYVMNKALGDYISPLEEMLCDVSSFASHEVLSDSEVERGNRLLLYLHCCLAGHAYPFGSLPQEQMSTVPYQVYQCITSLKGKDGVFSNVSYPYLRLLLTFDAQQFTHLLRTCSDAPVFQSEGRLQRLIENIGRLSIDLRCESALVHFLLLVSQLTENNSIIIPIEIVDEVVTTLMRMTWQHSSTEFAIVETLQAIPQLDRKPVLRMALSPMRLVNCAFSYVLVCLDGLSSLVVQVSDLLLYWLPTGSRSDFCLNLAAESDCPNSTVLLMETRNRLDDAFEILFQHMNSDQGDQDRFGIMFVYSEFEMYVIMHLHVLSEVVSQSSEVFSSFVAKNDRICVQDQESTLDLLSMRMQLSRKVGGVIQNQCVLCRSPMAKAAYVFR